MQSSANSNWLISGRVDGNLTAAALSTMPSSERRRTPWSVVSALLKKGFYLHSGSGLRGTLGSAKYQTSEATEGKRPNARPIMQTARHHSRAVHTFGTTGTRPAPNGPRSVNTGPLPHEDNKRLALFANTQVSSKARLSHLLPLPLFGCLDLNM